ncbi:MAG: DUF2185 domain-containing protein [Hellea sp.]
MRRKIWGKYVIDDPRPIKADSPYTFFLPSADKLDALEVGDGVKIIIRSIPAGIDYGAERMWINITSIAGENITGSLDNRPFDIPQLKPADIIQFKRFHIIDYQWKNKEKEQQFPVVKSIQQWGRCLVDSCVLERGIPVGYLYKEEPDMDKEGDKYPDSGWRIRGDTEIMTDEENENTQATYIALGKVLNVDDSWIHLIDEPIGSRFFKNKETGKFEQE